MILREYPLLVPVLGRLLNKRKKDTRTKWWWGFEEFRKELGENALNSDFFVSIWPNGECPDMNTNATRRM